MFAIPAPYASTPTLRNEVRLEDLRTRLASARNNLDLATQQLDSLIAMLSIPVTMDDVDRGRAYTFSELVGRNFAEVNRLTARYAELSLEALVLASSMEVTR